MPTRRVCTLLLTYLALVCALSASHASAQRMVAVASIFPVADLVAQVGGERWEVLTLIPAGASPHTYEPTPEQVRQLSQARIFFQVGLGLEFWLAKLVRAAKNATLVSVDLSEGIETLPTPPAGLQPPSARAAPHGPGHRHRQASETGQHHSGAHEGLDAHYWLDPVRMQQVVGWIEHNLRRQDPEHSMAYQERGERVRTDLANLHEEILQLTRALPNRRFISLHSAWTYFAPRYRLEQAAVIEPFPGREPSPRYLAELAKLMRREGIKAIVIEPQLSPSGAQTLARETGARVGRLDPLGGRGVPGRDSYVALMRYNLAELQKLLQ